MSDAPGPSDNRGTIARYIEALRRAGADPSAEDIADALWLLLQIDPREGVSLELPPWREQEPQPPPATTTATSADQDKGSLQGEEVPESHRPAPDAQQSRPGLDLLPGAAGDGAGRSGALLKTPQATALPGTPEIARALRPFRRRVSSRTIQVIDEQATAQRTAEERLLSIVLRPVRTRWLAVDLVIDESASMAVWQRTVLAFRRLLVRLGAFRNALVAGAGGSDAIVSRQAPPDREKDDPADQPRREASLDLRCPAHTQAAWKARAERGPTTDRRSGCR